MSDGRAIVIFGASGDLTSRKLLPALYALHREKLLPSGCAIVGFGRTEMSDHAFRAAMRKAVKERRSDFRVSDWDRFAKMLRYVCGEYTGPGALSGLAEVLASRGVPRRRLFYVATPPSAFPGIIRALGEEGLHRDSALVVEKPFGRDLASAQELNELVHKVFDEDQVFRIDHYLGKETVQNILVFRFSNGMFEPIWNRRYVTRVEITVAEEEGTGHRGRFYEEAGALRDIVQNHIFQVITFLAMEPPVSFEPEALRTEKAKVLQAMRPVDPGLVVRGQYAGYRSEPGVSRRSDTETFVAMRLALDSWRWSGVPFFVRTGKRLPQRVTEVTMSFHDAPHALFRDSTPETNHLTLRIQPDEGICLSFDAKVPGPGMRTQRVDMDFSYARYFDVQPPEAYERLLGDALAGDHTLFPRADEVERAWTVLQPVLDAPPPLCRYRAGTWGPSEADELVAPGRWNLHANGD